MNGIIHLALNASFLVQLVMLTLIILSVWSWVIILNKRKELKVILKNTIKFNKKIWSGIDMHQYYMQIKDKSNTIEGEEITVLLDGFYRDMIIGNLFSKNANNSIYYTGGNVGIGLSAPTEKLDVSGNIKATGFDGIKEAVTNSVAPEFSTNSCRPCGSSSVV